MAGDNDTEEVGAAGGSDGADGLGRAHRLGYLGVGAGFAAGDFEQGLPDALLEGGGADVEGEGGGGGVFGEAGEDEADGFGECGIVGCGAEDGLGEAFAKFYCGFDFGVCEEDSAEAPGGGCDQELA
jgi:hypothetical protein